MIAIMHGLELGLSPLSALQRIAVINGRPTIWGDGALALVKASGLCEAIDEWIEGEKPETWVAVCNVIRRGDIVPTERRFSVDDAKRAKLWGKSGPWSDYPKRMLQMRARAFALRDAFPDVLGGLYLTEEWLGPQQNDERQSPGHSTPDPERFRNMPDSGMIAEKAPQYEAPEHARQTPGETMQNSGERQAQPSSIESQGSGGQKQDDSEKLSLGHLNAKLPPLANLRRARKMPRSALALRFRKQWSIRQPKSPAPSKPFLRPTVAPSSLEQARQQPQHNKEVSREFLGEEQCHSDFVPEGDAEAILELFDAALWCAFDQNTLLEIAEEFEHRLSSLSRPARLKSEAIFARHAFRIPQCDTKPIGTEQSSHRKEALSIVPSGTVTVNPSHNHQDLPSNKNRDPIGDQIITERSYLRNDPSSDQE